MPEYDPFSRSRTGTLAGVVLAANDSMEEVEHERFAVEMPRITQPYSEKN